MGKEGNVYYVVRLVIFLTLIGVVLALLGWVTSLNGRLKEVGNSLRSTEAQIQDLTTSVASLTEKVSALSISASRLNQNISVNLPSLGATSVSLQSMGYVSLLRNAPLSVPSSLMMSTVNSSSLQSFKSVLSKVKTYEITEFNGVYYLAYPADFGKTYSIQLLSSPYPDRVMDVVKTLRSMGKPAFAINYANQSALFLGVFPTYKEAKAYQQSLNATALKAIIGTAKWLLRPIH